MTPSSRGRLRKCRAVPQELVWEELGHESAQLVEAALETLRLGGVVLVSANVTGVQRLDFDAGFPTALERLLEIAAAVEKVFAAASRAR